MTVHSILQSLPRYYLNGLRLEHNSDIDVTGGIRLKLDSAAKITLETETNLWILDGRKPQRIIEAVTKMRTIGTHILKNEEEAEQRK